MSYANPASEHGNPMCAFCRREASEVVDLIEGLWIEGDGGAAVATCQTCLDGLADSASTGDPSMCAICRRSVGGRSERAESLSFTLAGVDVETPTCDDCYSRAVSVRVEDTPEPTWLASLPGGDDGPDAGLELGDRVIDRDDDSPSAAEVVDLPGATAAEKEISGMSKTVAAFNPEYPSDDPVVGIRFSEGGTTYHYPASRLEVVGDEWEGETSKTAAQREREQLIEEHRDAFEAFRHATLRLAEAPEKSREVFERGYDPRIQPETRGECRHTREDEYRPDDDDAIVCWECNGGGPRPRKLHAGDDVPDGSPCAAEEARSPVPVFKSWFGEEVAAGNEDPRLTPEVVKAATPNPDFSRLHWVSRDLIDGEDSFRRSAVVRIGWEATVGGLLDEEYNNGRACAFLRDLGVDTNEVLPGGDPHVGN